GTQNAGKTFGRIMQRLITSFGGTYFDVAAVNRPQIYGSCLNTCLWYLGSCSSSQMGDRLNGTKWWMNKLRPGVSRTRKFSGPCVLCTGINWFRKNTAEWLIRTLPYPLEMNRRFPNPIL